ncbi:protein ANTAGONIST OF LIKE HETEROCHROMATIN PROTEIN 1-like isoform X2 [Photinus pyralis]|uniref:DDE Tnp4 domain-containing protein n=2 Tax=Photinus pyralis TaxID=7054 RepID=A0A1Y1K8K0_PHOPY|nr:protein ANTAGONIST OF LIKE HETEROCHROMATIN PROTEIN 1-like isoform X2 [Photinus pyralis]
MSILSNNSMWMNALLEEFCIDDTLTTSVHIVMHFLLKAVPEWTKFIVLQKQRKCHFRMPLCYEEWITNYLDTDFFIHFRMIKSTYFKLTTAIGKELTVKKYRGGFEIIPLEKEILITLWYLAKGETLVSISDRFNVSVSKAFYITMKIIKVICSLMPIYIKWPNAEDCEQIANDFQQRCNYPDVIGAIDGCHITCKIPKEQHDSYQDRKFCHSITLQGVCISSRLFTNISVGYPGSVHDARILRESDLGKICETNCFNLFYGRYHLVGDSAYPLRSWLITPYRNTGIMPLQRKHNYAHSVTRVVIENTFGMLKGRWRILNFVNVYTIEKAIDIITACCILHNFCLLTCDIYEVDVTSSEHDSCDTYIGRRDREGARKRDLISQTL